jgi:hypothetical protein
LALLAGAVGACETPTGQVTGVIPTVPGQTPTQVPVPGFAQDCPTPPTATPARACVSQSLGDMQCKVAAEYKAEVSTGA